MSPTLEDVTGGFSTADVSVLTFLVTELRPYGLPGGRMTVLIIFSMVS